MACEHCSGEHWNIASRFPTPGVNLRVRLDNGDVVEAIRPRYVSSYNVDPGYVLGLDEDPDRIVRVVAWQYK